MQKVAISEAHGSMPVEAIDELVRRGADIRINFPLGRLPSTTKMSVTVQRDDPELIRLIEEWGPRRVWYAIVEIPDGVEWEINDYDGYEWVAEKHRKWFLYDCGHSDLDLGPDDRSMILCGKCREEWLKGQGEG